MALTTPTILDGHFDGLRNLTRGNAEDGKELETILQAIRTDLAAIAAGTEIAAGAIDTTHLAADAVTIPKLAPLTAGMAPKIVVPIACAAAAGDNDVAVPVGMTLRITDAKVIQKGAGGAGDTVQVKSVNAGPAVAAVTDIMDTNKGDKLITRAGEIDDAGYDVVGHADAKVRATVVDGGAVPATLVIVDCYRTA